MRDSCAAGHRLTPATATTDGRGYARCPTCARRHARAYRARRRAGDRAEQPQRQKRRDDETRPRRKQRPDPQANAPAAAVWCEAGEVVDTPWGGRRAHAAVTRFGDVESALAFAQQPCASPRCAGVHTVLWKQRGDSLRVRTFGGRRPLPLADELEAAGYQAVAPSIASWVIPAELNEELVAHPTGTTNPPTATRPASPAKHEPPCP